MVWYSGEKIRRERLTRGLTSYALSRLVGISCNTMVQVEAGNASARKVKQVADYLGIPMESLLLDLAARNPKPELGGLGRG